MNNQLIAEYVQNGINLLDEKEPSWRSKINKDTLDVASYTECPLGQVYRECGAKDPSYRSLYGQKADFVYGLDKLGLLGTGSTHGFGVPLNVNSIEITMEWKRVLNN